MLIAAEKAAETGVSNLQIALIAGGFALVGALLGFLASLYTKRQELERADRVRWDNQILSDALEVIELTQVIRNHAFTDTRDPLMAEIKESDESKQMDRYRSINHRLSLIASNNVNTAAARLMSKTLDLGEQRKAEDIKTAREGLNEAVKAFRSAVRRELHARD